MELTLDQRLHFFQELIYCGRGLYSWSFSSQFELKFSNCPDAAFYELLLSKSATRDVLMNHASEQAYPVIFTNVLGLVWVLSRTHTEQETIYHLIGPAFFDDVSQESIYARLQQKRLSPSIQHELVSVMGKLPVIPMTKIFEYAIMLHFTLTRKQITNSDLQMHTAKIRSHPGNASPKVHGTWAAEQALLKLVEDGNLEHLKIRAKYNTRGNVGKMSEGNPLRQVKNQIIVYTTLCTRAAIRGGLPPETAYALSDHYIQMAESFTAVSELAEINRIMQDDFIRRVHRAKNAHGISRQILICQDYIQLHLGEKMTVKELAQYVGYSETYLSKKFKQETGKTILDYINECRIESAKTMLVSCELSIQEISERLGFGTQSYFGAQFKKLTGISATEYRNRNGQAKAAAK